MRYDMTNKAHEDPIPEIIWFTQGTIIKSEEVYRTSTSLRQ